MASTVSRHAHRDTEGRVSKTNGTFNDAILVKREQSASHRLVMNASRVQQASIRMPRGHMRVVSARLIPSIPSLNRLLDLIARRVLRVRQQMAERARQTLQVVNAQKTFILSKQTGMIPCADAVHLASFAAGEKMLRKLWRTRRGRSLMVPTC